jgi:ribose transport system ATP-binding protein
LIAGDAALDIAHLSKTFPGTVALDDVSFRVRSGEIHALVGGNGSGKSTLLKILAGVYRGRAGGAVRIRDEELPADRITPRRARTAGLRFVHQDLGLFAELTVAENLAVGSGFPARFGAIDRRRLHARARRQLDRYGIAAHPDALVRSLSPAERTMLAVARALADIDSDTDADADAEDTRRLVLVLDEATAALPVAEATRVYEVLRQCADRGHAALFVSHRLDEVVATADCATVLRDGNVVGSLTRDALRRDRLVEMIVGRAVRSTKHRAAVRTGRVALEVRDLEGGALRGITLTARHGEILGLAGPLGSGRSDLLRMLFGARPVRRGTIELHGRPVRFAHVADAMRAGIAYVPQDRTAAAFPRLSVRANLVAAAVASSRGLWLGRRDEELSARRAFDTFGVRASSPEQEMDTLSGGNQQKVILARWLRRGPAILLLDEPTRGVDVAARADLHRIITDAAASGSAVIVASDDFDELSVLADRVAVMVRGTIVAELRQPDADPVRIAELAYGAGTRPA